MLNPWISTWFNYFRFEQREHLHVKNQFSFRCLFLVLVSSMVLTKLMAAIVDSFPAGIFSLAVTNKSRPEKLIVQFGMQEWPTRVARR